MDPFLHIQTEIDEARALNRYAGESRIWVHLAKAAIYALWAIAAAINKHTWESKL